MQNKIKDDTKGLQEITEVEDELQAEGLEFEDENMNRQGNDVNIQIEEKETIDWKEDYESKEHSSTNAMDIIVDHDNTTDQSEKIKVVETFEESTNIICKSMFSLYHMFFYL